jgi:hypothetical protein
MKRTALVRRTPLRAKRKKPPSHAEVTEMAGFRNAIFGKRCVVCGANDREARWRNRQEHGLEAGLQAHHAIRQQVLRKLGLPVWDVRLAVPVCEEPCHRQHTSRKRRIKEAELPDEVISFVLEHGLQLELEKEYPG